MLEAFCPLPPFFPPFLGLAGLDPDEAQTADTKGGTGEEPERGTIRRRIPVAYVL